MTAPTLLGGPAGAESFAEHQRRLGARPLGSPALIEHIERSGLVGRGGASFPAGAKWRAVASGAGPAVVIANGAEGEPLSHKDQVLMATRPHLVIDGAQLAAESVGADRIFLYVGESHRAALAAMASALQQRPAVERARTRLLPAPPTYTAGEETAAVHFVNERVATPTAIPPRPFEAGVDGRPTLVQNVESLAHAALLARNLFPDTVLLTVGGGVARPGVYELHTGGSVGEALGLAGGARTGARAVLLGGYFGGWIDAAAAAGFALDPRRLKAAGGSLGCGVMWVLDPRSDPLLETARVIQHLAEESAAQCGPCFFGLRSLAGAAARLAGGQPERSDLPNLHRWVDMVRGRGACRHPDGAVAFMASALQVFAPEYAAAGRRAL
ncbi:MAG TPA: NADH-ubiquinone oxidoreductase-F iron-sulfur binding region domain-containing protein [Candidatus Dormibacteraeota bacterium]